MASALRENDETDIIILSDEEDEDIPLSNVSQTQQANKRKRIKAESDENSDVNSMCMTEKLHIKDDSIKEETQQQVKKQPLSMTNSNANRRGPSLTNGKASKLNSEDVGLNSQPIVEDTKKFNYDSDSKLFFSSIV